jgi:hypothetical protein
VRSTQPSTIVDQRIGGLLVQPDQLFTGRRDQLVLLTTRHAIPTIEDAKLLPKPLGGACASRTSD